MHLLKGLDINVIGIDELGIDNEDFRIDSQYFARTVIAAVSAVKSVDHSSLGEITIQITDGIHTSLPFTEEGTIKVISAKHPKDGYFDLTDCDRVSETFHLANPRTALRVGDVLISTVGTIGNAAVVDNDMLPANSDRHVGIIRLKPSYSPNAICAMLISKYGRVQTSRETTGNVQQNLFISKLNKILIPTFTESFEKALETALSQARSLRRESESMMNEAHENIEQRLGLDRNWIPSEPLTYIRKASDVNAAGRLDAEFFSPKTNAIRLLLRGNGDLALGEICTVGTGFPWESKRFVERGEGPQPETVPFVRIRDCKPGGLDGEELDRLPVRYVNQVKQPSGRLGDLVIGMDGLKWFYCSLLLSECHINQRVAWLHHFESEYPSSYLMAVINSVIGQSQLLSQMTIAHTVGHITLDDLRQLRVPSLDRAARMEIAAQVQRSMSAKERATSLVASIKLAIEIAIERGESHALRSLEFGTSAPEIGRSL